MVAKKQSQSTSINEAANAQSQFVKILFCADSLAYSEKTEKMWIKGRMQSEAGVPRKVINVWGLSPQVCREVMELCESDPFLLVEVVGFFDQKKIQLTSGTAGNMLYSLNNAKVLRNKDEEQSIKTQVLEIDDVPLFTPKELSQEELATYSRKSEIIIDDSTLSKSIEEAAEEEAAKEEATAS